MRRMARPRMNTDMPCVRVYNIEWGRSGALCSLSCAESETHLAQLW